MDKKIESVTSELNNCEYCQNSIPSNAKVCHYCGKYQNKLFNNIFSINAVTTIISLLLLVLAYFQYRDSNIEKQQSIEASRNAKLALEKVEQTEQRILLIRDDIVKTSQAFIEVAEILPRSTGYGAGLSDEDHQKLKMYSDSLNVILNRLKINKLVR